MRNLFLDVCQAFAKMAEPTTHILKDHAKALLRGFFRFFNHAANLTNTPWPVKNNSDISALVRAQTAARLAALNYPEWIKGLTANEKEWFEHYLNEAAAQAQTLNFVEIEDRYRILEKYEGLYRVLKGRSKNDKIMEKIVGEYAAALSYAGIYDRLIREGVLEAKAVHAVLDLGVGYWNYAFLYPVLFQGLNKVLGVESDAAKLTGQLASSVFGLPPDKFEAVKGDFFNLGTLSQIQEHLRTKGPFDLILLQNYYPDSDSRPLDYAKLFASIGKILSEHGKLIIIVDEKDLLESDNLKKMHDILSQLGAEVYKDKRITPRGYFGMVSGIETSIYVISKDRLLPARPAGGRLAKRTLVEQRTLKALNKFLAFNSLPRRRSSGLGSIVLGIIARAVKEKIESGQAVEAEDIKRILDAIDNIPLNRKKWPRLSVPLKKTLLMHREKLLEIYNEIRIPVQRELFQETQGARLADAAERLPEAERDRLMKLTGTEQWLVDREVYPGLEAFLPNARLSLDFAEQASKEIRLEGLPQAGQPRVLVIGTGSGIDAMAAAYKLLNVLKVRAIELEAVDLDPRAVGNTAENLRLQSRALGWGFKYDPAKLEFHGPRGILRIRQIHRGWEFGLAPLLEWLPFFAKKRYDIILFDAPTALSKRLQRLSLLDSRFEMPISAFLRILKQATAFTARTGFFLTANSIDLPGEPEFVRAKNELIQKGWQAEYFPSASEPGERMHLKWSRPSVQKITGDAARLVGEVPTLLRIAVSGYLYEVFRIGNEENIAKLKQIFLNVRRGQGYSRETLIDSQAHAYSASVTVERPRLNQISINLNIKNYMSGSINAEELKAFQERQFELYDNVVGSAGKKQLTLEGGFMKPNNYLDASWTISEDWLKKAMSPKIRVHDAMTLSSEHEPPPDLNFAFERILIRYASRNNFTANLIQSIDALPASWKWIVDADKNKEGWKWRQWGDGKGVFKVNVITGAWSLIVGEFKFLWTPLGFEVHDPKWAEDHLRFVDLSNPLQNLSFKEENSQGKISITLDPETLRRLDDPPLSFTSWHDGIAAGGLSLEISSAAPADRRVDAARLAEGPAVEGEPFLIVEPPSEFGPRALQISGYYGKEALILNYIILDSQDFYWKRLLYRYVQYYISEALQRYPASPYPIELHNITNPSSIQFSKRFFQRGTLEISETGSSDWHRVEEASFDPRQLLKIQKSFKIRGRLQDSIVSPGNASQSSSGARLAGTGPEINSNYADHTTRKFVDEVLHLPNEKPAFVVDFGSGAIHDSLKGFMRKLANTSDQKLAKGARLAEDLDFGKQGKVVFSGNSSGSNIIENDENGNGTITRNNNGAADPWFGINQMVSFVTGQFKIRQFKNTGKSLIGNGGNSAQSKGTALKSDFTVFGHNERGRNPIMFGGVFFYETFFLQYVLKSAHALTFLKKKTHRLFSLLSGLVHGITTAGDSKLRAIADESLAFLKYKSRKFNLHIGSVPQNNTANNPAARLAVSSFKGFTGLYPTPYGNVQYFDTNREVTVRVDFDEPVDAGSLNIGLHHGGLFRKDPWRDLGGKWLRAAPIGAGGVSHYYKFIIPVDVRDYTLWISQGDGPRQWMGRDIEVRRLVKKTREGFTDLKSEDNPDRVLLPFVLELHRRGVGTWEAHWGGPKSARKYPANQNFIKVNGYFLNDDTRAELKRRGYILREVLGEWDNVFIGFSRNPEESPEETSRILKKWHEIMAIIPIQGPSQIINEEPFTNPDWKTYSEFGTGPRPEQPKRGTLGSRLANVSQNDDLGQGPVSKDEAFIKGSKPLIDGEFIDVPEIRYCLAVHQSIRESIENRNIRALYGGSGEDFIKFLLITNATEGYFIDREYAEKNYDWRGTPFHPVTPEFFNEAINKHWDDIEQTGKWSLHGQMIHMLKAMGVKKEDIRVADSPLGESELRFKWKHPYDAAERERVIILKHGDITKPSTFSPLLANGIDIYIQLGSEYPAAHFDFIRPIAEAVSVGGYVITNNYVKGSGEAYSSKEFLKETGEYSEAIETPDVLKRYSEINPRFQKSVHVEVRKKLAPGKTSLLESNSQGVGTTDAARLVAKDQASEGPSGFAPENGGPKQEIVFLVRVFHETKKTGDIAVDSTIFKLKLDPKTDEFVVDAYGREIFRGQEIKSIVKRSAEEIAVTVTSSLSYFQITLQEAFNVANKLNENNSLDGEKVIEVINIDNFNAEDKSFDALTLPMLAAAARMASRQKWSDNTRYQLIGDAKAVERALQYLRTVHSDLQGIFGSKREDFKGFEKAAINRWVSEDESFTLAEGERCLIVEALTPGDVVNFGGMMVVSRRLAVMPLEANDKAYEDGKGSLETLIGRRIENDNLLFQAVTGKLGPGRARHPFAVPKIGHVPLQQMLQAARLALRMALQAA